MSRQHPSSLKTVDQLISDFKLSRVPTLSNADDEKSLHFKTVDEAREFLSQIKSQQDDLLSGSNTAFATSFMKGVSDSQKSAIDDYQEAKTIKVNDNGYDGNEGNETPPGSGYFSQRYLPWNQLSVYVSWDSNNNITSMQSFLTGYTLGLNWNQLGYNVVAKLDNGTTIIKIDYTISYTLFVEGIGTLYTSNPSDSYAVIYGGGYSGGGTFSGSAFSNYWGAYNFAVRIVGQQ